MIFAQDTFESVHRRKKLAAWLGTLKGPAKPKLDYGQLANAYNQGTDSVAACQVLQNAFVPQYVDQQNAILNSLGHLFAGRQ